MPKGGIHVLYPKDGLVLIASFAAIQLQASVDCLGSVLKCGWPVCLEMVTSVVLTGDVRCWLMSALTLVLTSIGA